MVLVFLLIGAIVSTVLEFDHLMNGPIVREFNYYIYDKFLAISKPEQISERVVIVDIDERSLAAIGQWPWPRHRLAVLLEKIDEMRPASIGLDILMPEPDRTSLRSLQDSFHHDFGIALNFEDVPADLFDNDEYLGSIIRSTPTVSSFYFLFDHVGTTGCDPLRIEIQGDVDDLDVYKAPGLLCNEKRLRSSNHLSGFINTLDDEDGVLRRMPLLISYEGELYPSLALAVLMHSLETKTITIERDFRGLSVQVADLRLFTESDGTMLLPFPGPAKTFPYISAVDVLTGSVPADLLYGKIVFIGSSAAGLYDFHHTVFDPNYPGVETLAVATGSILEGITIGKPIRHKELSVILSLLTATAVILLFVSVNRPAHAIAGIALLLFMILGGGLVVFSMAQVSLSLGAPFLIACILFTLFSVVRYGTERRMSYLWFQKMARSQQVTLETMAMVVETRDYETGGHIRRTQHFVKMIAMQLSQAGHYKHILTPEYIELLFVSAPLHDIGKVGVPDHILLKPGPLDYEEFEKMKRHTDYGRHILINSGKRLESDNFLELACEIAESHHEKWDGSGYPLGLAGEEIPLSGRIMMIADVYDALTSKRCYKSAYSHERAVQILKDGRGIFFDPLILDAFLQRENEVVVIREQILD